MEVTTDGIQAEIDSVNQRENRLLDIYLNGDVVKEVYEERLKELKNKKVELTNSLNRRKAAHPSVTLEQIKSVFEQANTIRNDFLAATPEQKKHILQPVLWNISIKGKEVLTTQYKNHYHILANAPKTFDILTGLGYKDSNLN